MNLMFSVERSNRHEGEANKRLINSQDLGKFHLVILILSRNGGVIEAFTIFICGNGTHKHLNLLGFAL